MAHRRNVRDTFAPKIRNKRWDGALHTFVFSAGTAAQTMVTSAASTDTIMRIRGELVGFLDGLSATALGVHVAIGAIVMPEGQGTTVVSSPITDAQAPWLFYEQFWIGYEEMVTDVVDVPGITSFRKTVDVKAMRILRPDRELQLVVEQATAGGASSINLQFAFRLLLGQH